MRLRTHWFCVGFITLLGAGLVRADDTTPDASLEIIQFKAPPGWKASEQPGGTARVFMSPDSGSTQQAVILIMLAPAQDKLDLRTAFDGIVKQMTQNGKLVQSSEVTTTKTRQGFEAMSQTMVAEVAGGQKVNARVVAANVQNRVATFCFLATTTDIYDKHQPDMDAVLKSVGFTIGAGAPAAGTAVAAAAKAEYDALEKQKQELLQKLAAIDARQRQLLAAASTPATGTPKVGVPIGLDDAALAKAKEQFTREVDGRRKAHTILGTVLTLDGRPIPNVATCSVQVSGTTIAAEKTHYTIEVDQNGHFELQVPDGLYRLSTVCHVTLFGHQVQADLIPIDGRKLYADQPSTQGIVKDYRLVLNALKPEFDPNREESYFGGILRLDDPTYTPAKGQIINRHPGTKLRISFAPLSPLIDGSKIDPFAVEFEVGRVGGQRIYRIPLGAYRVTAGMVAADGSVQALTCSTDVTRTGPSADVYWERYQNSDFTRTDPILYLRD